MRFSLRQHDSNLSLTNIDLILTYTPFQKKKNYLYTTSNKNYLDTHAQFKKLKEK